MANKLPWFTHDHNARNDDFIRRSEEQFGHFGYAAYFKILELIHEHGCGDILKISSVRLCQELRSKRKVIRKYLESSREANKIVFTWNSDEINIQIKKFRERQSKLKSNLPSTFRQPSVNLPIEGEVDIDREGERQTNRAGSVFGFEEFWKAYPRKDAKQPAIKAWSKLAITPESIGVILAAVAKGKASQGWIKDNGQFIPMAATWLNQRRWEDESVTQPDEQELANARYKKFKEREDSGMAK